MNMKSEWSADTALDGAVGILSYLREWFDAAFEGGPAAVWVVLKRGEGGSGGVGEGSGREALISEGGGGLGEGRSCVFLDEVGVDVDHEGLVGVVEHGHVRDVLVVVHCALHERHGGLASEVRAGGQAVL
jgi:hypothetical protein